MVVGTADGVAEGLNNATVLAVMTRCVADVIRQWSCGLVAIGCHTRAELQWEFWKVQVPHHCLYASDSDYEGCRWSWLYACDCSGFLWCSMVVGTADGVTEGSNAATVPADMTHSPLQM